MAHTFDVTLEVTGLDLDDETQLTYLEDGPHDVLAAVSAGRLTLDVTLSSNDVVAELLQYSGQLATHGIHVVRADLDLVSTSDIAERVEVSRETVRLWASGERKSGFPVPFTQVGRMLVWAWADVYEWLVSNGRETSSDDEPRPVPTRQIEEFNGSLSARMHGLRFRPVGDFATRDLVTALGKLTDLTAVLGHFEYKPLIVSTPRSNDWKTALEQLEESAKRVRELGVLPGAELAAPRS